MLLDLRHADFVYNYGQYFTLWDRLLGTYKPATQTHKFFEGRIAVQAPARKAVGKQKSR
jgi:sterol desaturase/sphingolipid hydroxylase (fatty acid hydroxylase superfamily)